MLFTKPFLHGVYTPTIRSVGLGHAHILSIQQDRQCTYRQLVLLGETIVLTLVQIQLHLAVCVLAHSELLMRAAGTYRTSRCCTKGQINTVWEGMCTDVQSVITCIVFFMDTGQ